MASSPAYIAKTGDVARSRLAIQHRVFAPGTETLLAMAGFRPDMRVLIVGCGCGDETVMIAEKLGPDGRITALDKSPEQIEQTRQVVEVAGFSAKVSYLVKPLEELSDSDGDYDLILCRLVMPHLASPVTAIDILKNRLSPRGVLASQEPIVSSCYADPASPALTEYLSLMLAFAESYGLDFDMAKTIPELFRAAGLKTQEQSWQPVVLGEDKCMVTMSASECMPAILKQGLIEPKAADDLIAAIDAEVVQPKEARLFQCVNVLTVGEKCPEPS